jgi:glycosyltransferase involved in cell wall biosynthesis
MHLVIDATEVGRGRGGNETYIAGLIEGLSALASPPETSLLTCEWEAASVFPPEFRQTSLGLYRQLPFFLWQQTVALHRLEADWYVSNYYLPLLLPCKGAVVVHDLSFRAHPEYYPRAMAWYMRWLTAWAVRLADRVLTVSAFSQQELIRYYPAAKGKVCIVPNGVGSEFRPRPDGRTMLADMKALSPYSVAPPYILAVGNIHPRKNLSRLLDAYLDLRQRRNAVPRMVWAGAPRWGSDELLQRARSAGVILTGFVAQEDLPALYRGAAMLVYPSLYEGFGLPPVEAMACGTPVITSNTTSLPEVVGKAALTVDPTNVEAIAGAMARLLDDAASRQELTEAGIRRSRRYTWPRAAQGLLAALQGACYNRL